MDTKLTKDWSDFDPEEGYEKEMQDVMLHNGDILYCCWPNAGYWNIMRKEPNPTYYGQRIAVGKTAKVRLTHDEDWC